MDLMIEGRKAIMAGGSAGMGRATAERLAEAGGELFVTARREQRLVQAAKEIVEHEGASVLMATYAAFGLEPEPQVVQAHFRANNDIPAGFVADAKDLAPMAALLCSELSRFSERARPDLEWSMF